MAKPKPRLTVAERFKGLTAEGEIERLEAEIERLKQLAGEFFQDLSCMGEYLFWKHYRVDLEENPWLEERCPFPAGSPYFPETLNRKQDKEEAPAE